MNEKVTKAVEGGSSAASRFFNKYIAPELIWSIKGPLSFLSDLISRKAGKLKLNFDFLYFILVMVLTTFGLAMHYSASYDTKDQLKYAIIGFFFMIVISMFYIKEYVKVTNILMFLTTIAMVIPYFTTAYHGTHRWLWGIFQPSELGKVALIMFMAYILEKYKNTKSKKDVFWAMLAVTAAEALILLVLENHLSGCILFTLIGISMMWFCGYLPRKWFAVLVTAGIVGVLFCVFNTDILAKFIDEYQVDRIVIWKKIIGNADLTKEEKRENARQVLQSLYGIGSGGLTGKGFGNSAQKVDNLQEQANDFIFAVIGEELGFIGAMVILIIFAFLVYRGFKIGLDSGNYYGRMICFGISTQMALQVLINISVATSLLPNTGISLPFFSEGGSSMLFTMCSMGLVLGVSAENNRSRRSSGLRETPQE